MPRFIRFVLIPLASAALWAACLLPLAAQAPATSTLTVKISGIRNTTGNIRVALLSDASTRVQGKVVDIDAKTLTATAVFENVPQGTYGVAAVHDENMNGKLDFSEQGVPLEGYGHSNNPARRPGPPDFDEYKFALNQPAQSIEIALIYWQ